MLINKEMLLDALRDREWLYHEDAAFSVNYIVEKIRDFPEAISKDEFADRLRQPDELKRALIRIIDAIDFQNRILAEPNCNNCLRGEGCAVRPEPGETSRFNCPYWTDEPWPQPPIIPTDKSFFVGRGRDSDSAKIDGEDLVQIIKNYFQIQEKEAGNDNGE